MKADELARATLYRLQHPEDVDLIGRIAQFMNNPANVGTASYNRILELFELARQRKAQGVKPQ
ncbi:MAG TPA: hypothetical protein VHL11_17385 [Phototrophicaceae bacterium]|jgi:hypothetical protein|nr:hypothetical protein [Phototrophicaceae bacterium]